MLAENSNANMQIITIFVTETLMKENDIDRDLWLIAYFRCRQINRNCRSLCVTFYTHLFLLKEKRQPGRKPGRQPGRNPFSQVIWPGAPWPRAATGCLRCHDIVITVEISPQLAEGVTVSDNVQSDRGLHGLAPPYLSELFEHANNSVRTRLFTRGDFKFR